MSKVTLHFAWGRFSRKQTVKYLLLYLPATAQCRVMETVSPAAAGAPLRLGFQLSALETPVIASYTSWPERKNACLELEIVHLTIITLDVGPLRHLGMSLFILFPAYYKTRSN